MKTIKIVILAALVGITGQSMAIENSASANHVIVLIKEKNLKNLKAFVDKNPTILKTTVKEGDYNGPLGNYPTSSDEIRSYLQNTYNLVTKSK